MRTLGVVASVILLAGSVLAQRPARPSNFGSGTGFGNIIFPGTGRPPANPNVTGFGSVAFPGTGTPRTIPFSITDPTFARGLGNTVSGRVPFGAGQHGRHRGSTVFVPYAYPVYTGGYDAYAQQQQQQPNVTVVYPAPQPPVVINQSFVPAQPMLQEMGAPASGDVSGISVYQGPARSSEEVDAAASQASQPYYLIAFKDHSIYSAVAYWIDGETLHYFTSGNTHNQVSMALVDKELTERLNKERKVDVRLK